MELLIDFLTDPTDFTLFFGEKVLLTSSDAIKQKKHLSCLCCCVCCSRCKPCCTKCQDKCKIVCCTKCKDKCKIACCTKCKDKCKIVSECSEKCGRRRKNEKSPENEISDVEKGVIKEPRCNFTEKCICMTCFGCGPCVRCREKCSKSCLLCKPQCCKSTQKGKPKKSRFNLKSCFICKKYRNLKPWEPIRRNNIYLFLTRMWIGYLFDALEIILLATSLGIEFQNQFWQAMVFVYFVGLVMFALVVTLSVPICKRVHVRSAAGKKLIIPFGIVLVVFKVTSCVNAVFIFTETYTQRDSKPDLETLSLILLVVSAFDMILDAILMVTTCKRWIHCHLKQNRLKPIPVTTNRRQSKVPAVPKSLAVKPGPLSVPVKKTGPPSPGALRVSPIPPRRASITSSTLPKPPPVNKLAPIKQSLSTTTKK